ncbi:acyltransferase [Myxococcus stipitatus]|uniref:acyltransferase family protein n=1 Tax=Myxococcus stipitatus TaxID=83455 RepID=UPI001F28D008|nr:acyltransferase [Myxococcus stipitatus]MCE9672353.1 acyltransferase [Myxococcus stipitatus]
MKPVSQELEPNRLSAHLPALDGLRGIAVLMVIAYHSLGEIRTASIGSVFQTGWAGVDLFFVLSGFLITGILLRTRTHDGYFRAFFARRALRIWPLYLLLLAFTFGVMGRWLPALAFDTQRYPWWLYALYLQNIGLGEFGPPPLNVTWSLAIEEQFYLVWPLLVFFLRPAQLRALLCSIILLSPVARCAALLQGASPHWLYVFPLLRLDGLALGGLLALGIEEGRFTPEGLARWGRRLALPMLLAAFGLGTVFFDRAHSIHTREALVGFGGPVVRAGLLVALYSLWSGGFASLLGWVLSGRARGVQDVLESRLLRLMGQLSYGLYLFHALVFPLGAAYTRPIFSSLIPSSVVATALSFAFEYGVLLLLTCLSWRFFEQPLLRLKERFKTSEAPGKGLPASV